MPDAPSNPEPISLPGARAIGPYSDAVRAGGMVYLSGRIGLDHATGGLIEGGVAAQTRQCLSNIADVLAQAGLGRANVVRSTVFLTSMSDFEEMNREYAEFFWDQKPARSTVAVAGLPLGALVEIEVTALV